MNPDQEYTDAARARVAVAAAARSMSDAARQLAATDGEDSYEAVFELLDEVNMLVGRTGELLSLAVIHARERNLSWTDIGKVFGVSRQAAHERYAGDVEQWHDALFDPARHTYQWMPEGAYNPEQVVPDLDAWLARHHTSSGEPGSVSAGLPRYDAQRRVLETLARANWMSDRIKAGEPVAPAAETDYRRRQGIATAAAETARTRQGERQRE